VVHDGKYAHVGAMLPGIKERAYLIADISNPTNPKEAGALVDSRNQGGRGNPAGVDAVSREHFHVHSAIPTATVPTFLSSTRG